MARVLLLGGTEEARRLAEALSALNGVAPIASLAGKTARPAPYPCETRIGGFGGAAGLAAYLRGARIRAVLDATHPFAARISANAVEAARMAGAPRLAWRRAPWRSEPGDRWSVHESLEAAAAALPAGARALLAVGAESLAPFALRADVWRLARVVGPEAPPLGAVFSRGDGAVIAARPPFRVEDERALFAAHRLTHVVAKNAGGPAGRAKLIAAREAGLRVLLVAPPPGPPGPAAANVEEALAWLAGALDSRARPCGEPLATS